MINKIIGGFVVLMVGCSLLPEVSRQISNGCINYEVKKEKSNKQTYLQYVQERLNVEKEMRRSKGMFWWLRG